MARAWVQSDSTVVIVRLLTGVGGWDFDARTQSARFSRCGNYDEWPVAYMAFNAWLDKYPHSVLVSHGCFRKDKPTFEHLMRYYALPYLHDVTFFDTLHWARSVKRRKTNVRSFSLKALYKREFGTTPPEMHCSRGHVDALWRLLSSLNEPLYGYVYPLLLTPLQTVRGIGTLNEQLCVQSSILCVEDLCHCMRSTKAGAFAEMLQRLVHIKVADAHTIATHIEEFALLML